MAARVQFAGQVPNDQLKWWYSAADALVLCSSREGWANVLLEASGAAFEPKLVKLHKGEHQTEEYKKMNPRGQVPVLVADGTVITQIVAICGYIADAFPAAQFMPTDALKKARMQQTLAWMNNTVHPTFTWRDDPA